MLILQEQYFSTSKFSTLDKISRWCIFSLKGWNFNKKYIIIYMKEKILSLFDDLEMDMTEDEYDDFDELDGSEIEELEYDEEEY